VEPQDLRADPDCRNCGHRASLHRQGPPPAEALGACRWPTCSCRQGQLGGGMHSPLEGIGEVRVPETWLEAPVGRDWIAAYRIAAADGPPVIAELRVFPAEAGRPGRGRWSGEVLGTRSHAPRGGITVRLLRRLRPGQPLRFVSGLLQRLRTEAPETARALGWTLPPAPTPPSLPRPRRGRPGRTDLFYARVAAEYVHAVQAGSPYPVADLARRRRQPPARVRDMIHTARRRGLLSPHRRGVRGGELTDRANALLSGTGPPAPTGPCDDGLPV
jgi:hypothetical protein